MADDTKQPEAGDAGTRPPEGGTPPTTATSGSEASKPATAPSTAAAAPPTSAGPPPSRTVKKPKPPVIAPASVAGKTTSAAARSARTPPKRAADDSSPLLTRRAWIGLSWGAFTAASAAALAATGRFMFPNVLTEPPQQFKVGLPGDYGMGVDERWKDKFGIWLIRTPEDVVQGASGFYALISVCTHLGCTPNWLSAELKFKCPCHGSGFRPTGINFEGPAPRPLERARVVLADDGQILVDKSLKYQFELGQWTDPESFLQA